VLVLVAASHAVLAKHLYAVPPAGVPAAEAARGAMLMYYGGDVIEIALAVLLCRRWLLPRSRVATATAPAASATRAGAAPVVRRGVAGRP
jgi:putative membrane protein